MEMFHPFHFILTKFINEIFPEISLWYFLVTLYMLRNVFNCSGIARSTQVLNTDGENIYFPSSSNIMVYKDESMIPILRAGADITHMVIRDGIILCDSDYRVEMNNRFSFIANEPISTINKTNKIKIGENIFEIFVFCTLTGIYFVFEEEILTVNLKDIASMDCEIKDNQFLVFCGDLHGNFYKIVIPLDELVNTKVMDRERPFSTITDDGVLSENAFSKDEQAVSQENHKTRNISHVEHLFNTKRPLKELENIKEITSHNIAQIKTHEDTISNIKITSQFVITCSHDHSIKLINKDDLGLIDTLLGHSDIIHDCFYDIAGEQIFTAGADNTVICWRNSDGWKNIARIGNNSTIPFFGVVALENNTIYVQDYFGALFKYSNGKIKRSLSGHSDKIVSCDINQDLIITGSNDFTVRLYKDNKEISRPVIHGYPIQSVVFFEDLIAVASEENILRVFEATEGVNQFLLFKKQERKTIQIATPSDLSLTNELYDYEKVYLNEHSLQNILCYKEKKKLYGQFFANSTVAANDNFILCANKSANLKFSGIFVYVGLKMVQYIAVHNLSITKIEISSDDKLVLAVSRDGYFSVYEITDTFTDENIKSEFTNKKCDESGIYLKFLNKIKIHTRTINSLCINKKNKHFVTCSKDKGVKMFDLLTYKCLNTIYLENEPTAIRFINDYLLIGQSNGSISVYNSEFVLIFSETIHSKKITEIRCHKNKLVTVGEDWLLRVFIFDP